VTAAGSQTAVFEPPTHDQLSRQEQNQGNLVTQSHGSVEATAQTGSRAAEESLDMLWEVGRKDIPAPPEDINARLRSADGHFFVFYQEVT